MSALALATIDDVSAVARPVPDADVARVTRLIEFVSSRVVLFTRQEFLEATTTITIRPHDGKARLPQRPVTAVSSVLSSGVALTAGSWTFHADGRLERVWPASWSSALELEDYNGLGPRNPTGVIGDPEWPPIPLTVVYTHGYPAGEYPVDIASVVAEKVAAKWLDGERRATGIQSVSVDGYSESYQQIANVSAGNAWDPEHLEVLEAYRGPRVRSVRLS